MQSDSLTLSPQVCSQKRVKRMLLFRKESASRGLQHQAGLEFSTSSPLRGTVAVLQENLLEQGQSWQGGLASEQLQDPFCEASSH